VNQWLKEKKKEKGNVKVIRRSNETKTKKKERVYIWDHSSMVERESFNLEAVGSSPIGPIIQR
jgi:hypothetical protein